MWFHKRSQRKSLLGLREAQSLQDGAAALLDAQDIPYVRTPNRFLVTVDKDMVDRHAQALAAIEALVKRSRESGG